MPFKLQFSDVQNDIPILDIAGCRPDSERFLSMVNEVEQSLMIRGGWLDLEQRIRFCISGCHIVWPQFVGTILAVKFCDGSVAVSRNGWYSFAPNQSSNYGNRGGLNNFSLGFGTTQYNGADGDGFYLPERVIEDDNARPCYNDVSCSTGAYIRYTVDKPNDNGKKITIYGKKVGGGLLQERVDGAYVNGVTLTAKNPYAQGFDLVAPGGIQSITREATEGCGYLWEYDPACGTLRDIAVFQPGETNPRYRTSRIIQGYRRTPDSSGCCWTPIEAKIKLQFVPIRHERDFIPVDNLRALKLGIQAVKLESKNEDAAAEQKWAMAVHELNLELRDKSPEDKILFQNNTFGSGGLPHRRIY